MNTERSKLTIADADRHESIIRQIKGRGPMRAPSNVPESAHSAHYCDILSNGLYASRSGAPPAILKKANFAFPKASYKHAALCNIHVFDHPKRQLQGDQ